MGEYDRALNFYNKALKIRLKVYGYRHADTGVSFNNLGLIWMDKGDYNKATEYLNKGLEISFKVYGKFHPDTGACFNNLGLVWNNRGEYDNAITSYENALEVFLIYMEICIHQQESLTIILLVFLEKKENM